jgi:hypothetical protein
VFDMKVKINPRPLVNHGPADCRCCSRLNWKDLKLDKQILKEAVNDADYALSKREQRA